jgi:hypothetical protein
MFIFLGQICGARIFDWCSAPPQPTGSPSKQKKDQKDFWDFKRNYFAPIGGISHVCWPFPIAMLPWL